MDDRSHQCTLAAVGEQLISGLSSSVTRAMYGKAIRDFLQWFGNRPTEALSRSVLEEYRTHLTGTRYSSSTINQRLSAVRRLVLLAGDKGLLAPASALVATRV